MRNMWDALNTKRIVNPPVGTMLAGYVDNSDNLDSFAYLIRTFPSYTLVSISTEARFPANILDIERGATDPSDRAAIVNWVNNICAGKVVYFYATDTNYAIVKGYFPAGKCPLQWKADWDHDRTIDQGTIGTQYANSNSAVPPGAYDSSVMLDYIEGIDTEMTQDEFNQLMTAYLATNQGRDSFFNVINYATNQGLLPSIQEGVTVGKQTLAIVSKLDPTPPPIAPSGTYTYDAATGIAAFTPDNSGHTESVPLHDIIAASGPIPEPSQPIQNVSE